MCARAHGHARARVAICTLAMSSAGCTDTMEVSLIRCRRIAGAGRPTICDRLLRLLLRRAPCCLFACREANTSREGEVQIGNSQEAREVRVLIQSVGWADTVKRWVETRCREGERRCKKAHFQVPFIVAVRNIQALISFQTNGIPAQSANSAERSHRG